MRRWWPVAVAEAPGLIAWELGRLFLNTLPLPLPVPALLSSSPAPRVLPCPPSPLLAHASYFRLITLSLFLSPSCL